MTVCPARLPTLEQAIDRYPFTIAAELSAAEALDQMRQRGWQTASDSLDAIVAQQNRLVGVLTERDLVRLAATGRNLSDVAVREAMSAPIATCYVDHLNWWTVLEVFRQHPVQQLPILDAQDQIVGVIERSNLGQELSIAQLLSLRSAQAAMVSAVTQAPATASLQHLAQLMTEYGVSYVVIVEERSVSSGEQASSALPAAACRDLQAAVSTVPVGIVTGHDIVQFQALSLDLATTQAQRIMSTPLWSVGPDDSLWAAYGQMQQHHVQKLAITGAAGDLLGILTQDALLQAIDPLHLYETVTALQHRLDDKDRLQQAIEQNQQLSQTVAAGSSVSADSNLFLQEVINTAKVAIGTAKVYADGTWINDFRSYSSEAVFGYSSAEFAANDDYYWVSRVYPEDIELLDSQIFEAVFAERPITVEYRYLRKDDVLIWVSETITSKWSADLNCWTATLTAIDITERKRAEEALLESEARFQALVRNMPGMVYRYGPSNEMGAFYYVSSGAQTLFELEPEAILKDANTFWSLIHPDDFQSLIDSVAAAVKDSLPWRWEGRVITPSGQLKWIQGMSQPEQTDYEEVWDGILMDITDRKQLEAHLRQYEQIVSATPILMSMIDRNYTYRLANRMFLAANQKQESEVVGHAICDVLDREFFETVVKPKFDRCLAGETIQFELWFNYAALGLQYASVIYVPCIEADGSISGVIASTQFLTEIKLLEEALQQSETQYRLLFEHNPNPMWIFDPRTLAFLAVNQAAIAHYGYSESEFLALTIADIRPQADVLALRESLIHDTTPYFSEWRHLKRNGELIDVEVSAYTISWAGQPAQFVLAKDITARKRAEAALRESELRFRTIFEQAGVGIAVALPPDYRLSQSNPGYQRLLGYTAAELAELNYTDITHPDDIELENPLVQALLNREQTTYTLEKRYLRKDKRIVWVNMTCSLFNNSDESLPTGVAIVEDITDRKQAEQERQRAEAALRQSEAQIRAIFVALPDIISLVRTDGTYLELLRNNADYNLIPEHVDPVGRHLAELLPPDIATLRIAAVQTAVATGELQTYEQQVRVGDRIQDEEVRVVPYREDAALVIVRNVTEQRVAMRERQRAEFALEASQNRLSMVLNSAPISFISLRLYCIDSWEYDYFSPGAEAVYGYSAEEFRAEPDFWRLRVVPEDWQNVLTPAFEKLLAGETAVAEYRFRQQDGSLVWIRETAAPRRDEALGCWLITVVSTNITDRKQAEERIEQQARREQALNGVLQTIRNSLDLDTIFATAVAEICRLISTDQCRIWQYLPEQEVWRLLADHVSTPAEGSPACRDIPDQHNPIADQLKQFQIVQIHDTDTLTDALNLKIAERVPGAWLLVPLKVEQQIWGCLALVKSHSGPWEAFEVELTVAVADQLAIAIYQANLYGQLQAELTERNQIEAALRSSEVRFRTIFVDAPIGMALIASDERIAQANQALVQMLGYSESELRDMSVAQIVHPADRSKMQQLTRQLFNRELQQYQLQKRLINRMGDVIWVRSTAGLLLEPNSAATHKLVMFEDITERRAVDKMKDSFVSIVSHELRTPLAALRGSLGLLETGLLGNLAPEGQELLSIAASESERLIRLVSDILDLERLKSGHIPLVKTWCRVPELIARSINSVRSQADRAGIWIDVAAEVETVWADGDRIIQTLTNLLSNAIKFSFDNATVAVSAEVLELPDLLRRWSATTAEAQPTSNLPQFPLPQVLSSTLSAHPHPANAYLLFSVSDRGRGIPGDKLHCIFEPFEQVEVADSREEKGTGLGLAICQNIVHQHQGVLWVASLLGQGSCFYFALPQNPYHPEAKA